MKSCDIDLFSKSDIVRSMSFILSELDVLEIISKPTSLGDLPTPLPEAHRFPPARE